MTDGIKTFTMPSGGVEKGTYVLDGTKIPKQIDATTEGKAGTQMGIYAISGDTLQLCLSQQGCRRPEEFATQKGPDTILIVPQTPSRTAVILARPLNSAGPKPRGG